MRGAGDLASGTILKLYRSGYQVIALETSKPSAIRRRAAFSEAVYAGVATVEGVTARLAGEGEIEKILRAGEIPVVIDPDCKSLKKWKPEVLIDAILAKKNLGTRKEMAPVTIALGPGFTAGTDVDAVVETKRGHHLGRIYYEGTAIPNTGIPGMIGGYGKERVIHSPCAGKVRPLVQIGDVVEKGDMIARVDETPVYTELSGVVRGMIPEGFPVSEGFKMADVDPRKEQVENISTVSDKARCIAGGVLEAILYLQEERRKQRTLLDSLQICMEKHRLIAVVGAGGKTSLLYSLAKEIQEAGYRAAITTTTHMEAEGRFGFTPVGAGFRDGKIQGVAAEIPKELLEFYDVVLVEADGSRRLPFKVPAAYEPVIPEGADLVIGVAGASAVGQTFKQACCRYEAACERFGCRPEDIINLEHLAESLSCEWGQKKSVCCEYRYFLNQAELLSEEEKNYFSRRMEQTGELGCVASLYNYESLF